MSKTVAFTIDVEDPRVDMDREYRVRKNVDAVLQWLDERSIRGTAFVVGTLAQQDPDLVRVIANHGHEIGLHSWTHTPLEKHSPADLTADLSRGRALLQDLAQQPVNGFRAPIFSLTERTPWAPAAITSVGFTYSSSVLPARNPLFGLPTAPRTPFRWETGLLELPSPVGSVGPLEVPFLGGTYLRLLPKRTTRRLLAAHSDDVVYWTYCHPWDFDAKEDLAKYPETSWPATVLCYVGRKRMFKKLESALRDVSTARLGDIADDLNARDDTHLTSFNLHTAAASHRSA